MNIIDTVDAAVLEVGDTISYAGDTIEILGELESSDDTRVSYKVHNLDSGMVEPLSLRFDQRINILGE